MFNENSKIVQDYALLIKQGLKSIDEIQNFSNLKEMVEKVLKD